MNVDGAREYYALEYIQKLNCLKRKRLLEELETEDENDDRLRKRVKEARVKMSLDIVVFEKNIIDLNMLHLENKYNVRVSLEFMKRRTLGLKVGCLQMEGAVLERLEYTFAIFQEIEYVMSDKLQEKYIAMANLNEELRLMPYARPLNVIPATTISLSYHPHQEKLCFETGTLNADIWRHNLFSSLDRAALRSLRQCNVSFAILVHSLPPEITGYYFCT
jgi:hypothetical protein